MPNKLSLGYDSFTALKNHPDILERVKYTGSSANPAVVNENVLAQILGFAEVKVLEATYNAAEEGQLQLPGVLVALHHVHPGHDRLSGQVYFQFVFDIHHVNPLSPEGGKAKSVAQKKATQRKNPSALLKIPYQSAVLTV